MTDDYARRIDDAQRQLAELRAAAAERAPADHQPADPASSEATGRAGDGAVEAVAASGRLRAITLAPQLMRRTDTEIGDLLAEAANQALRQSRARLLAGAGGDVPSLAALETSAEQVRDQGERAMYEIQAALNRAIGKVGDRTGLAGDTGGQGLDQLLAALAGTLRAAQGKDGTGAGPTEAAGGGRGADDDGHVSARVDAGGTVTGFVFGPWALRLPSSDLAAHAVTAVNAALADAQTDGAARSAADLADLRRRVGELREASVSQMTQLTASLTGIMSRIREP